MSKEGDIFEGVEKRDWGIADKGVHIKDRIVFDMDDFYIDTIHVKRYHIQRFSLTCTSTQKFSNLGSVCVKLYHKQCNSTWIRSIKDLIYTVAST